MLRTATSVTRSPDLHSIAHLDHDLFEIEFIEATRPSSSRKVLFLQEENFPLFFIAHLPYGGTGCGSGMVVLATCFVFTSLPEYVTRLDRLSIYPSPISPLSPSPANLIVFGLNLVFVLGGGAAAAVSASPDISSDCFWREREKEPRPTGLAEGGRGMEVA